MNARALLLLLLLFFPISGHGQGFAGLGASAEGFRDPVPGATLTFPQDHGAHPAFRIEWWYVTANLAGDDGQDYGVQWTLFRTALRPEDGTGWQTPQLWMGNAALTSATAHFVSERLARGGIGQAGVTASPFAAFIDDWSMQGDTLATLTLSASAPDFTYDLSLAADGPLVLQGDQGYSVKSGGGQASYYYSQPFYQVTGTITLPQGPVTVTGRAWLDHEYSSRPLSGGQTGWDWFSLHLDGGEKLMGFRLREGTGGYYSATWIAADGTPTAYPDGALRLTPMARAQVAGRSIPTTWRVELPAHNLDITTSALNSQAWMQTSVPYWEGPITATGSHSGRGYLEMTGYD